MLRRAMGLLTVTAVVGLLLMVSAQEASSIDVQKVAVIQGHAYQNGVTGGYFFSVMVEGTGLSSVRVVDTSTNANLTYEGANVWWYDDPVGYATYAALTAAHPASGALTALYFNEAQLDCDVDVLGYNVTTGPTGFATITNPLHNATGVPLNPNYTWNSVAAIPNAVGIAKFVDEMGGPAWYEEFFDNDLTQTSWQPGALAGLTDYDISVAVVNLQGGLGMPLPAMTNTRSDAYDYYGVFAQANQNDFTTMIPEPGTIALLGTALMFVVGLRRRRRM